jgi:flavin-dependent dehydrogenase
MRRTPALIVGGGPAGAAAAIVLARGGLQPEVIERNAGPTDIVCGGFLGWDALAALRRLGLEPASLGARPIERLRLVSGDRQIEARLPKAAAGLSRRRLDSALLDLAGASGAKISLGSTARSGDPGRRLVRLADGEEIEAEALLLATGKHELRGLGRPEHGGSVGLRTALAGSPALGGALEGTIELHLFDGGYAGLLIQEDDSANFCLSVSRQRLGRAGSVEALMAELAGDLPLLRERLEQGEAGGWSAVSGVPYGWRARATRPGLFRLGDQAAVIASLAGDGIAIALESGMAAARALLDGSGAQDYQRRLSRRAARPLGVAEMLRWAAERRAPRAALMRLAPRLAPLAARLTRIGSADVNIAYGNAG